MPYHLNDRAREPTCLHISYGGKENFCDEEGCGNDSYPWPERCMEDAWARTLPICPDCERISAERRVSGRYAGKLKPLTISRDAPAPPQEITGNLNDTHRRGPLYLIDYRRGGDEG